MTGGGAGQFLRWVEACARTVAKAATGHTIVVEKSTLPVRTAAAIKTILQAQADDQQRSFSVLSNTESWRRTQRSWIWRRPTGC